MITFIQWCVILLFVLIMFSVIYLVQVSNVESTAFAEDRGVDWEAGWMALAVANHDATIEVYALPPGFLAGQRLEPVVRTDTVANIVQYYDTLTDEGKDRFEQALDEILCAAAITRPDEKVTISLQVLTEDETIYQKNQKRKSSEERCELYTNPLPRWQVGGNSDKTIAYREWGQEAQFSQGYPQGAIGARDQDIVAHYTPDGGKFGIVSIPGHGMIIVGVTA